MIPEKILVAIYKHKNINNSKLYSIVNSLDTNQKKAINYLKSKYGKFFEIFYFRYVNTQKIID